MSDKLVLEGVFSKGYGTVPKLVMKDEDLTIEAKGIYAYLCSYAGAGETAFPSVDLICSDLGIGENRFYKHRKLLVDKGYLRIERVRQEKGFSKNIYTICSVVSLQNDGIRNETVHLQNEGLQNEDLQNEGTNNNSLNNNSLNKDNNDNGAERGNPKPKNQKPKIAQFVEESTQSVHVFYQDNFGLESPYIAQELEYWIKDLNVELVLEAMKRAKEYGGEFGYAKRIMKSWVNKGIDSLEKVKQADVEFENKNKKKYGKRRNYSSKKETLPDWANDNSPAADAPQEIPADDPFGEDISNRLEQLSKLREEQQSG